MLCGVCWYTQGGGDWGSGLLRAVVKLAWAVLLRECSSHNTFSGKNCLREIASGAVEACT